MTKHTASSASATASVSTSGAPRARGRVLAAVALALAVALTAGTADARAGGGSSSGSRGMRTYSAPAITNTAPRTAAPMERSLAPTPGPGMQQTRPAMGAPAAQPGGFFSRGGFLPGLLGGLIGAGIGGMLFGHGFFGGIGGFAGILGLLLQIALIVVVVRLVMGFFRNRSAGASDRAYAGPAPSYGGPLNRDPADVGYNPMGGMAGGMGGGASAGYGAAPVTGTDEVGIGPADYEAFERTLVGVQTAYGREDLSTLRGLATPEMLSYFADDLAGNSSRGVVNKLSDVHLAQGDLAESWREGDRDYATVAMRYTLVDVMVDRATGRVVEGDPNRPEEVTEIWTFLRARGGHWLLSAIQQTR